jgi:hypothetical protein
MDAKILSFLVKAIESSLFLRIFIKKSGKILAVSEKVVPLQPQKRGERLC